MTAYDAEHVARGVDRLIERYRKPRTSALLASWLTEVQAAEDALWQLYVERSLATAEGAQLDVLGSIVGQPREERSDDVYRVWISARNLVSRSSGRATELVAIARKLVPPPADVGAVRLEEYYPAALTIRITSPVTLELGYQIAHMLFLAKAGGVKLQMIWMETPALAFRMAPSPDTSTLDSPHGFDGGVFATVSDGATIPVTPDEPEVALGQVMIQGVPVVIQGVPLVITPPPLMAARLPTIYAKPASIVPRALALPAPLVGETVELVDAFDDASLEMNTGGDKFRVAQDVQDTVVALVNAVDDLETGQTGLTDALTTLEGEVDHLEGAVRFDFTLRTTSVDGTAYEEIGLLRLDPTDLGAAWTFVAELEVALAGQTVECQLYNLTAAAAVATVSSVSLVTEKRTAAVTLPLSEQLYSVRLRRTGGDSSQRVSCRSAAFER
jgi:hypothetical protein